MYIQLFNKFSQENSKYHLSIDELYIYSLLKRRMDFSHVTVTTIDLIIELSSKYNNIKIHSKKSEARKRIINHLQSLINKGVIKIDGNYTKHNNIIEVSFIQLEGGFVEVEFDVFDNITNITDLYIYYVVARYNNKNNDYKVPFNCTDERWMRILGVNAIETVRKYIKQAINNGLIYKNTGDYKKERVRAGQNGQDVNQYKVVPFKEEEKSNVQRKKEREGTDHSTTDTNNEWGESDSKYPFDTGNWLNSNNLDVDDYIIYLKHKNKSNPISKDFIAECNQKRNRLDKNGKFKMYIEKKLIEQALEEIEQQKQKQNELIEEQAKRIIDDTNDVVVMVDGKLLPYAKWDKVSKVEKVYYLFGKWVSQIDSYVFELYSGEVVDNEDVERFRPDKNGEWDNEEKQLKREMELEIKLEKEAIESDYNPFLDDFEDINDFDWGQSP